jgi:hypothetical protein
MQPSVLFLRKLPLWNAQFEDISAIETPADTDDVGADSDLRDLKVMGDLFNGKPTTESFEDGKLARREICRERAGLNLFLLYEAFLDHVDERFIEAAFPSR